MASAAHVPANESARVPCRRCSHGIATAPTALERADLHCGGIGEYGHLVGRLALGV